MKRPAKRPIRIRKRWIINPKSRIKKSERIYKRARGKKEISKEKEYEDEREDS